MDDDINSKLDSAEDQFNLTAAQKELESIIEKMEDGDLPLEESIKLFEKGMQLSDKCQQSLTEATQKVQMLMDKHGKLVTESLPENQSDTTTKTKSRATD